MNDNSMQILVWIVFFIAIVGMVLCQFLFQELQRDYPDEFIKIGSPHIILNNTPGNNWKFTKWIAANNGKKFGKKIRAIIISIKITIFIVWLYFVGGCGYLILRLGGDA
ncbi:hypothetical protein [Acidovorax sp. Leaf78]|uniref:hypothetical protein n=1 Tax=unclassified Acidovorax TaxID=2684926 RepID=UPI0012E280BB|nr:hypothetical protein [Acidovorax sp. Leaf78]